MKKLVILFVGLCALSRSAANAEESMIAPRDRETAVQHETPSAEKRERAPKDHETEVEHETPSTKVTVLAPRVHATKGPDAAVFMIIRNNSEEPLKLVKAETTMAAHVELHQNDETEDEVHPQKRTFLTLPKNGSVSLSPKGMHLMLYKISRPLKVGGSIPLTLTFSDGEVVNVDALIVAHDG